MRDLWCGWNSLVFLLLLLKPTLSKVAIDNCDWEGSGITNSVVPISLRCTRGHVKWHYPDSGLRITLTNGASKAPYFRGYFSVEYNTSSTVVIYVEGNKVLHRLYSPNDGKPPNAIRSFLSSNGTAVIYMESKPQKYPLQNDVLKFNYHLVPIKSRTHFYAGDDECRPCSEEEMISAYCESDIVLEGRMKSLKHNKTLQRSEMTFKASNVHKDINKDRPQSKTYVFYHPYKCNVKFDSHLDLLIIGQRVLGNPAIRCAPELELWQQVKSKAISTNQSPCVLH